MSHTYRCGRPHRKQKTYKNQIDTCVVKCECGGNLHPFNRDKVRDKKRTCRCDGYSYFHRSGTAPWCTESKREPTADEYEARYGPR